MFGGFLFIVKKCVYFFVRNKLGKFIQPKKTQKEHRSRAKPDTYTANNSNHKPEATKKYDQSHGCCIT